MLTLTSRPSNTISALQALRALAVVLVMVAHAIDFSWVFGPSHIGMIRHFENFGAIGVDLFFIISGVIIVIINDRSSISAGRFLLKRVIRILPLYWGLSLLYYVLPAGKCLMFYGQPNILKTITILPLFDQEHFIYPILLLGWTLSFEFLFYLIYALGIVVRKRHSFQAVIVLLSALVLTGICFPAIHDARFRFATNPLIAEFLLGCLAGKIYLSGKGRTTLSGLLVLTPALICIYYSLWAGFGRIGEVESVLDEGLGWKRILDWGIPCFLLVLSCLLLNERYGKYLPKKLMLIGDISYAAYLIHILCMCLLSNLWRKWHLLQPDLFIITAICFSLTVAYFIYKAAEWPLHIFLLKKLGLSI